MASVRRRGTTVRITLDRVEHVLLRGAAEEVLGMLAVPPAQPDADPLEELVGLTSTGPVTAPVDPALRRLLPDAYGDDDAAAAEFRRLTEPELRATKVQALQRMLDQLGEATERTTRCDITPEEAVAWLHGLADIRLALGTRLDVGEDLDLERARLAPPDPRWQEIAVYDWLSWLQEGLVAAVSDD